MSKAALSFTLPSFTICNLPFFTHLHSIHQNPSKTKPSKTIQTREMARYPNWITRFRRRFVISRHETTVTLQVEEQIQYVNEGNAVTEEEGHVLADVGSPKIRFSEEDIAAMKIQALFRGHLARQAFAALKSLVKLQAVVRGFCVRRQARIALHCMHSLVRLQVRVRARQLLSMSGEHLAGVQ